MASTDTRSGFRLPWSSDRSHDQQPADASADEAAEISDGSETVAAGDENVAWPESDLNARLGLTSEPRPLDPSDAAAASTNDTDTPPAAREDPTMLDQEAVTVAPQPAPRKPSKLMVDLSAAIRATAGTAREQALAQVDADVTQVVAAIRTGSTDGADTLRATSDQDIAGIKDWSRAEIARIKAETEGKIEARKEQLNAELAAHAAAIDARVAEVEGTAEDYRDEMDAYVRRLESETDPSQLATLAESMPEPPSLEALADLASLAWAVPDPEPEIEPEPEIAAEAEAVALDAFDQPVADTAAIDVADEPVAELGEADLSDGSEEAAAETIAALDATLEGDAPGSGWDDPAGAAWGEDASWRTAGAATAVAEHDETPQWAAGETPEGFPDGEEGGDPVDRGAIMAALEAAAEAVVAAESAAESAGQAEAAADVAETAAELLKGRVGGEDELDPEAQAAMTARVNAGGVEESYTDRLAKLLPSHGESAGGTEPRTTSVVVSGLVSVASIASFKRHLGRIGGVQSVTVASGPEGEFVFNVTHLPDVSFRETLPTLPGFAARVTGNAEGTVNVTARDPEAEG